MKIPGLVKHNLAKENGVELNIRINTYDNSIEYFVEFGGNYDIYSNVNEAQRKYDELKNAMVNHKYQFKTSLGWKPQTSACWTECPFAFNIELGDSCKAMTNKHSCPFVSDGIIDDECYE